MLDVEDLVVELTIVRNNLERYAPKDCVYIRKLTSIIERLKK